jgi:DNA end-binding protein Ku
MRSMWKGHLRFSLVTIPIQIFNAVDNSKEVHFNQLHATDNGKINYKKVCSECEKEVPIAEIVKGYEYSPDQFVVIKPEELENIKLESNKAIDIEAFVDISEVHPSRFEAVYYIGPSAAIGVPTFNLLYKALSKSNKAGVGRIVLREKEDVVLLVPENQGLVMYKLRYPDELKSISEVPDLKDSPVDEAQLKLADTLIDSLTKKFDDINFTDHYKTALMEIVNQKVAGKETVTMADVPSTAPVIDIMEALKASIEEAKRLKAS